MSLGIVWDEEKYTITDIETKYFKDKKNIIPSFSVGVPIVFQNEKDYNVEKQEEEIKNMSVLAIIYTPYGAVICSDSRETFVNGAINDSYRKIRKCDDFIIGMMGLYSLDDFRIDDYIISKLKTNKTIDEILNDKIEVGPFEGKKLLEIIPNGQIIDIFLAKQNGDVFIWDITNKGVKNKNSVSKDYIAQYYTNGSKNIQEIYKTVWDYHCDSIKFNDLEPIKESFRTITEMIVNLEKIREKTTNVLSPIGGEVLCEMIEFKK